MDEIIIKEKNISISGVSAVIGISDKEAEVNRTSGRVTIFGTNIQAQKLSLEQGLLVLSADTVSAVRFGAEKKKFSFRALFK